MNVGNIDSATVAGGCEDCHADTTIRRCLVNGKLAVVVQVDHAYGCPNYRSGEPKRPQWLREVMGGE